MVYGMLYGNADIIETDTHTRCWLQEVGRFDKRGRFRDAHAKFRTDGSSYVGFFVITI